MSYICDVNLKNASNMNLQNNPYYKLALDYIQQTDLTRLPNGKHPIDGDNLWVNITDSPMRTAAEARFEVHNKYVDIQIPLSGAEQYGIKQRTLCTQPIGTFNEQDDYLLFDDPVEEIKTVEQDGLIVFEPDTAHAPLIGQGTIHKAIFKVRVLG